MTKKDKDLVQMMEEFKNLTEKEKGYVLGLAEGLNVCKNISINLQEIKEQKVV